MREVLGYRADKEVADHEMLTLLNEIEMPGVSIIESHQAPLEGGDLLVEILIDHEMERVYPSNNHHAPEVSAFYPLKRLFANIQQLSQQILMSLAHPFQAKEPQAVLEYKQFLTEAFQRGYVPSISELLDRFTMEAGSDMANESHQFVMDKLMMAMTVNKNNADFSEVVAIRLQQFDLGIEILIMESIYRELLLDLMPMTMERYGEPKDLSRVERSIRDEYVALNSDFLDLLTMDPTTGNFVWLPELKMKKSVAEVLPDIHLPQALSFFDSPVGIAPMPNCD